MKITIVAFMQNPWFPPGTEPAVKHAYRTLQDFHKKVLRSTMSGQRLLMAFGEEYYERIWWDNIAPEPADHPRGKTKVDMKHVDTLIEIWKPQLVLTFGSVAGEAIDGSLMCLHRKVMKCHHPNAMGRTQAELDNFAQDVRDWVLIHERNDEFTAEDPEVQNA